MTHRPRIVVAALVLGATMLFATEASAGAPARACAVTAQAVYAVDHASGRVLCVKNAGLKLHPASTVKLLTALVVLERMAVTDEVWVSSRAAGVEPTRAGLAEGTSHSAGELLAVLLATSANDAAVALAEAVAGTEKDFAALMNRKARELGMRDSQFTNATGLPDKFQRASARDLATLAQAAFRHPFIATVMGEKRVTITGSDGKTISRINHNKLLWYLDHPRVLGKTGYTRAAKHCYAGVAYYGDRRVSVVILKSQRPWTDIYALLGIPRIAAR